MIMVIVSQAGYIFQSRQLSELQVNEEKLVGSKKTEKMKKVGVFTWDPNSWKLEEKNMENLVHP